MVPPVQDLIKLLFQGYGHSSLLLNGAWGPGYYMQLYSYTFQFPNTSKDILILCDEVFSFWLFHLHYWGRGFCCLLNVTLYEAHVFACLAA